MIIFYIDRIRIGECLRLIHSGVRSMEYGLHQDYLDLNGRAL